MSHVCEQVRQHIVAVMESVTPGCVFEDVHPETPETMPGCCVRLLDEAGSPTTVNGGTQRELPVEVSLLVAGVDVAATLHLLLVATEVAVFADESCGGVALGVLLLSVKREQDSGSGMEFSRLRVLFSVVYRTKDGDPEHGI